MHAQAALSAPTTPLDDHPPDVARLAPVRHAQTPNRKQKPPRHRAGHRHFRTACRDAVGRRGWSSTAGQHRFDSGTAALPETHKAPTHTAYGAFTTSEPRPGSSHAEHSREGHRLLHRLKASDLPLNVIEDIVKDAASTLVIHHGIDVRPTEAAETTHLVIGDTPTP